MLELHFHAQIVMIKGFINLTSKLNLKLKFEIFEKSSVYEMLNHDNFTMTVL
jgi:hypothetical protein